MTAGPFRAFGPSLALVQRPSLGANPPTVIDATDGKAPRTAGEPSLSAALSILTSDEVADYKTWGQQEKLMFLTAYQYIATATASGLRRPDGTSFDGLLTQGVTLVLAALSAASPYFKQMTPDVAAAADQGTSVLKDASTKTEPQGTNFAAKYVLLRDRVAWELATQNNMTIEYEILGTDFANPGLVYTRKIGEDKPADYSAVFSTRTPAQVYNDGLTLQDKFDALGVPFKKLNTLGVNLRLGVGAAPILAIAITIVIGILTFFWLWNHVNQGNQITKAAVDFVSSDSTLTAAQKADKLFQVNAAKTFFAEIFGGTEIPWGGIAVVATIVGVAALAVFGYPYVTELLGGKRRVGFLSGTYS